MSLLEMVLAMTISGVILAGLSAPLFLAVEANDESTTPDAAALQSARALADISNDLRFALSVPEQTQYACTVTVADRDGDLAAETIRIAWSATPGDPVTRQVNGGTSEVVAADVHDFGFSYYVPNTTVGYVRHWLQVGADARAAMETITHTTNDP